MKMKMMNNKLNKKSRVTQYLKKDVEQHEIPDDNKKKNIFLSETDGRGHVAYEKNFLSQEEADELFDLIISSGICTPEEVVMPYKKKTKEAATTTTTTTTEGSNKITMFNRLTAFFDLNDDASYSYSGKVGRGFQFGPQGGKIGVRLESMRLRLCDWLKSELGYPVELNTCIINYYKKKILHYKGSGGLGFHSDNEGMIVKHKAGLGEGGHVIGVTLGFPKVFKIQDKASGKVVEEFHPTHGSMMCMFAPMQSFFKHAVGTNVGDDVRVSLTFREIDPKKAKQKAMEIKKREEAKKKLK
jgi:alkylated DNA repair dioxygenase AlkB